MIWRGFSRFMLKNMVLGRREGMKGVELGVSHPSTYTITPNESWNMDIAPTLGRGLPARGKHTRHT